MAGLRAALAITAVSALGALFVSGGSGSDPRTPTALAGLPAPFLPTSVIGAGAATAGVDAYGDVVDLWVPGPVGRDLIHNPASRQTAGSVPANTGIVPRVSIAGGPARALWHSRWIRQSYLPDTNVLRTEAVIGSAKLEITEAIGRGVLICTVTASRGASVSGLSCRRPGGWRAIGQLAAGERRWLRKARPLGGGAPQWAQRMYRRSLLVLRALTDRRSGAVAAGTREGWAYVWPRDASASALALAAAGYRNEARLVVHFLLRLKLGAAARFDANGVGVRGRAAEGDAAGWVGPPPEPRGWAVSRDACKVEEGNPPGAGETIIRSDRGKAAITSATRSHPAFPARRFSGCSVPRRASSAAPAIPARALIQPPPGRCDPSPSRRSMRPSARPLIDWPRARAGSESSQPKSGLEPNPGAHRLHGAPGAWRRWESAGRRWDYLAICGEPPPRPDSSRSEWELGEASRIRPLR